MADRGTKITQLFTIGLIALLGFCSAAKAVEPQPGQIYQGNTTISVSALGVSFTIPNGWRGALSPTGEAFLMEPADAAATIFVIADSMSSAQALAVLRGPVPLSDVVQLELNGKVQEQQNSFSANYDISFNPNLAAAVRARSADNGTSIAFFLLAARPQLPSYLATLDNLFSGLETSALQVAESASEQSSAGNSGTDNMTWLDYLKGKHIVRFFTATGYTEEQHIWLCSNGYYVRRFDSGGFGGGASGAFQGNFDGRWSATGKGERGQLILDTNSGKTYYDLRWDYDKGRLYVDEKRWLHSENKVCE